MNTHEIETQEITRRPIDTLERPEEGRPVTMNEHTTQTKPLRQLVDESTHSPTIKDIPIVHSVPPVALFPEAIPMRVDEPGTAPGTTPRALEQQQNQRYAEILQEIRVAQTGVQFLLGFLMALAFTPRFTGLTADQRYMYVGALMFAFAATALLTAPAPFHRLVTRRGLKSRLVEISSRLALAGLSLLMLSMNLALLMVLDVVLGFRGAALLSGTALSWFLCLWFGLPLWHRITHQQPK